jgi:FKBP-type peptidyl-prolyl cis-trans isomerase
MKAKLGIVLILILGACIKDDSISPYEQLIKDIKIIDNYLSTLQLQEGEFIIKDASGVRLLVQEVGTAGIPPNPWNDIVVGYVGKLLSNGAQFDQNSHYGLKLSNTIIDGWKIGIALLPEGSVAKLFIPSGYAYGKRGRENIPGDANLVFDINLKSVELSAQQGEQLNIDKTAISTYLTNNEITNTTEHETGIRYTLIEEGTGDAPSWYDQVKISYTARLLNSETPFLTETVQPSSNFSSRLVNYGQAFIVAMQLLKPGAKGIFYVPSGYAFGPVTYPNVPANSNLVIEVESLEVVQP